MIGDCSAKILFLDRETGEALEGVSAAGRATPVALDDSAAGKSLSRWLGPEGAKPAAVGFRPDWPFNIHLLVGHDRRPRGIVQPHVMRWRQLSRTSYRDAVTLVSTPLYSNTTLVVFIPTLAHGGTAVLLPKFDAGEFLRLSERRRVTPAMLVPVQYRRIMERPDFDGYDLSSYVMKASTSAPFSAALMAEVLSRWPGGLVEFYGMTEGGGSTMLAAHEFPHKLHTVGQPMPGHDIRLIDEGAAKSPREMSARWSAVLARS
jgi:long-chain acyl-CoA synthetase